MIFKPQVLRGRFAEVTGELQESSIDDLGEVGGHKFQFCEIVSPRSWWNMWGTVTVVIFTDFFGMMRVRMEKIVIL